MLGGKPDPEEVGDDMAAITQVEEDKPVFAQDERVMIRGVLQLADRSVQSLMTPRPTSFGSTPIPPRAATRQAGQLHLHPPAVV